MGKFVITKVHGFSNFRFVRKVFTQFGIMTTIIFRTHDYFAVWFFIGKSVLQTHTFLLLLLGYFFRISLRILFIKILIYRRVENYALYFNKNSLHHHVVRNPQSL